MKWNGLLGINLIFALAVLPTQADLQIEQSQIISTGLRSSTIDSGDLDGDGDVDLAIANIFSHSITIAINNGDGSFIAQFDYTLQDDLKHPVALAVGDLDNDGLEDIAVAQLQNIESTNVPFSNASIVFLFNEGNGNFSQESRTMRGVPSSVKIEDIDQDGLNDVIVGNNGELFFDLLTIITIDSGLDIFMNQGSRNFSSSQMADVQGSVVDEVVFDFNDDGFVDIIAVNQGIPGLDNQFQLFLEETNVTVFVGTETGVRPFVQIPVNFAPWDIDSADFNGDGRTDVAVTLVGQSAPDNVINFLGRDATIEIFENTGETFTRSQSIELLGIAYSVMAEDFDMDGDVDLIATVQEVQQLSEGTLLIPRLKLFQNDDGNFREVASLAVEEEPRYSIKDDFDGDGDIDFAVLCSIIEAAKPEDAVTGRVYIFENFQTTDVNAWMLY